MAATADIGNDFKFQVGNGSSPEVFSDFCAVFDTGELGEEKSLIDITTLCSDAREYRNGLADGLEISLQVNFSQGDAQIASLYADYQADTIRNFRLVTKDSPEDIFEFAATVRSWRLKTPVGDRATATFGLKISGPVVWTAP